MGAFENLATWRRLNVRCSPQAFDLLDEVKQHASVIARFKKLISVLGNLKKVTETSANFQIPFVCL